MNWKYCKKFNVLNVIIIGYHFESITVPTLPIHSASFLGDTGSVVVSGRRPFFYIYDAEAGKVSLKQSVIAFQKEQCQIHRT